MKRSTFFHWYYEQGVHELLEIWKNYLFFTWRYFSIADMFGTLFSPWRRDVEIRDWRGWNPKRSLDLLFGNILSRAIGAAMRVIVISLGTGMLAAVFLAGLAAIFFWISAPLVIFFLLISALKGAVNPLHVSGLFVAWTLVSLFAYLHDTKASLTQMGFDEFFKHAVFERICGRIGVARKRFPVEILDNSDLLNEFLKARNLTQKDYLNIMQWEIGRAQNRSDASKFWRLENLKKISPLGTQWKYGYTVNLDHYCQDLSDSDHTEYSTSELIGRNDEYEVLKLIISRPDQNCALVVGSSGVGKKTLVHSLARRIRRGQENEELKNVRILLFDLGHAISDAISKGKDVENYMRLLFSEAAYAGNVILVVEHIDHFLGKDGSVFHPDISSVLTEFLEVPTFRIIATSTSKEYHQLIEKQEQIVKYFEVVEMREPSEEETLSIILLQMEKYERKRILFTYQALRSIIRDSGRHNWDFPLPERALDLTMDVFMFWEKKSEEQFVTEKTVADYLSLKTGVNHGDIGGEERKKLLNLEALLHRQVIGQEEAVNQVAEALRRSRSGIGNSKKPVGSFLFLGPTGVGKTEMAKALAKTYFGSEKSMIRLDMSEFQAPSSIDRLLGSSQLNQPGRLVSEIKDKPYSLLLLDEIEKAYPDILDIFLQILDEGFVTDAFGEKVNFRNAMIIATSNAGAAIIKKMVEQESPAEDIKEAVINSAVENNIFRLEFLNRFEGIIFFRPLSGDELVSVVRLQLQKFARRLAKEKNIEIGFDDGVIEKIIEKGYNPIFGARSLNRYIEETVEGLVAKKIIAGEISRGEKISINF